MKSECCDARLNQKLNGAVCSECRKFYPHFYIKDLHIDNDFDEEEWYKEVGEKMEKITRMIEKSKVEPRIIYIDPTDSIFFDRITKKED